MPFVLDLEPTFPANVPIPKPGGGGQVIRVIYRYVEPKAYDEVQAELKDKPLADLVHRLVVGWEEKDGKDYVGMPISYSREALDEVQAKQPRFVRSLLFGYQREVLGFSLGN